MDDFIAHIATLSAFPARIHTLVTPLNAAQLTFRPHNTEWSIQEHIGHLIDIDRVYVERIRLILAHEYQPFALFSIDDIHRAGQYHTASISALISLFTATRHTTVTILRGMTQRDTMRIGRDSYFGEITLARLIEILVNHADEHYATMCRISADMSHQ